MILTINNNVYPNLRTREDLVSIVQISQAHNAEIWLRLNSDHDGDLPRLCVLKNGQLCCVQYMTNSGALSRYYSYDANSTGDTKRVRFELANGDFYETYSTNCIRLDDVYAVMIHFLETNGGKSTWIDWQKQ